MAERAAWLAGMPPKIRNHRRQSHIIESVPSSGRLFARTDDGQVFWLPVHPRAAPSHKSTTCSGSTQPLSPGYSGGTATDLHRFPYSPTERQVQQAPMSGSNRSLPITAVNPRSPGWEDPIEGKPGRHPHQLCTWDTRQRRAPPIPLSLPASRGRIAISPRKYGQCHPSGRRRHG